MFLLTMNPLSTHKTTEKALLVGADMICRYSARRQVSLQMEIGAAPGVRCDAGCEGWDVVEQCRPAVCIREMQWLWRIQDSHAAHSGIQCHAM